VKALKWFGIAIGALVVLGVVVAATGSPSTPVRPDASRVVVSAPATTATTPTPAPAPSGPAEVATSGTYEVGVDLAPGRYKTAGPDQSDYIPHCYYARRSDDSGELKSIIANDNLQGPGSVTVKRGEFVEFTGSCTWTKQ